MLSLVVFATLAQCEVASAAVPRFKALTGVEQLPSGVELRVEPGTLRISWTGEGRVPRQRIVPRTGACEADAQLAAVIIAAWFSDEQRPVSPPPARPQQPQQPAQPAATAAPRPPSRRTAPSPRPAAAATQAPAVAAAPDVRTLPVPAVEPEEKPRKPAIGVRTFVFTPPPEPRTSRVVLTLRAAVADGVAPGGGFAYETGPRLGFSAEVSADAERSLQLGAGRAWWMRVATALGVYYRFAFGGWDVQPGVALSAAAVFVHGSGFARTLSAVGADVGGCASLRVGRDLSPGWGVFLVARGCGWPVSPELTVASAPVTTVVPRLDVALGAGVTWSWLDE